MYDPAIDGGKTSFLMGRTSTTSSTCRATQLPPSAASVAQGRALIGDPRNDENVIVGQLHLLFLRFHNKVVEQLRADGPATDPELLFRGGAAAGALALPVDRR